MLLSVLLAIIVTFVNLQHCPEIEKDSIQLRNESDSFNMNNSTDFLDNIFTGYCHCYKAETHSFPAMFYILGPK